MPTKKQIITFGVLCVIALGLGYWSGMPEEDSGQRAGLLAPTVVTNVVTNVLKEVVTNIVVAPQPTPTPPPAIAKPQPSPTPNPITPADEKLIADPILEKAVREILEKPEGKLTEADLARIDKLYLGRTQITDAGLRDVAKLQKLEWLDLPSQITDAGLKEVAKLQNLEQLGLVKTQITDTGLREVAKLHKLERLYLYGTQVTKAGVAEFQKALPNCYIQAP